MYQPPGGQPPTPQPYPPRKRPWHHRHQGWTIALVVVGSLLALGVVGAAGGSGGQEGSPGREVAVPVGESDEPTPAETEDPPEPPPSPDPAARYGGSCDYTLSPYRVVGEVYIRNTGNVGIQAYVEIRWPQFGFDPIRADKNIRIKYGRSKTVRFSEAVSIDQILSLQSWQERNGYRDGCKYNVVEMGTFGQAH